MSAPNPLEIYRILQVLRLFANMSKNVATSNNDFNCRHFGQGSPLSLKKVMNITPAISCRMADTCNPGTLATVILLATHVLPQIKLVAQSAR